MKTFNVFKHPIHGVEAIKVGFSWPAFFFGIIWMLVKKLWLLSGLWFTAYIVCSLIENVTDQVDASGMQIVVYLVLTAAYLALWLFPAFKGNQWREANLTKRGYKLFNTVQAASPDAACSIDHVGLTPRPREF